MICRFCSGLKTFSIRWTSINGIVVFLHAGPRPSEGTGNSMHGAANQDFQTAMI
jgi:hypothetical protein